MTKITLIGAGSTIFAKKLIGDILSYPELADVTLCLFDIDAKRLGLSERVAHRIAAKLGAHPKVIATTDRLRALEGSDYAINMIQVGGYRPATVIDFEIPKRYGLRQTIGDTLGVGGIMRALRTLPVLLAMTREMEQLCPGVIHLNYVNPMAMNCLALARASSVTTIGLCHSVQITMRELARDLGVPPGEVTYLCAGVNHMAFLPAPRARGSKYLPPPPRGRRRGAGPRLEPRALRRAEALRLLRDRVERALQRVRALVHQGAPPGPAGRAEHPARRVPGAVRGAGGVLGGPRGGTFRAGVAVARVAAGAARK